MNDLNQLLNNYKDGVPVRVSVETSTLVHIVLAVVVAAMDVVLVLKIARR